VTWRITAIVACLLGGGCLGSSAEHGRSPSTRSATHPALPIRRSVELALGPGHTRRRFTTRYPGGSYAILMSAPRTARYHVILDVAGIRADGFPRFRRDACTPHGSKLVCRAGPFEAIPKGFGPWRVSVVKTSRARARIRIRLRFSRPH
jgi:hypothetical protein